MVSGQTEDKLLYLTKEIREQTTDLFHKGIQLTRLHGEPPQQFLCTKILLKPGQAQDRTINLNCIFNRTNSYLQPEMEQSRNRLTTSHTALELEFCVLMFCVLTPQLLLMKGGPQFLPSVQDDTMPLFHFHR